MLEGGKEGSKRGRELDSPDARVFHPPRPESPLPKKCTVTRPLMIRKDSIIDMQDT